MDAVIRQLVSRAILASDEIIDVVMMAGLKKLTLGFSTNAFSLKSATSNIKNVAAVARQKGLPSLPSSRAVGYSCLSYAY